MMTAVEGYYNGTQIVIDENIHLRKGQRVIVTVLDSSVDRPREKTDLRKYMGHGRKMFNGNAEAYVKELRADDRV